MKNYEWIKDYLLAKKEVEEEYKVEWEATLYKVDNKMFVMIGEDNKGKEIITLKLAPETNLELQRKYPNMIVPGYYMNKKHWSSIYVDQELENKLLQDLLDDSYNVLITSLPKKRQVEINAD